MTCPFVIAVAGKVVRCQHPVSHWGAHRAEWGEVESDPAAPWFTATWSDPPEGV